MTGASGFSFLSPVKMPTLPVPNISPNSAYFELVNAFKGEAYQDFPSFSSIRAMAFSAIQVFPAPVGAVTRQSARSIAEIASNWKSSGLNAPCSGTPMDANTFFSLASAPGFIFRTFSFDLLLKRRFGRLMGYFFFCMSSLDV